MTNRAAAGLLAFLALADDTAKQFDFPEAAVGDAAALAKAMPALAEQVAAAYKDDDRGKYLDSLFRLQIVAGRHAQALETLAALRALRADSNTPQTAADNVQYEIFARAKLTQAEDGLPFDEALRRAFRATLDRLDDRTSALVIRALTLDPAALSRELQGALEQQKGKSAISLAEALQLIRAYQVAEAYRSLAPLAAPLIEEDDRRRYAIEKDIGVKTPDGATVCALVVRQRRNDRGRQGAVADPMVHRQLRRPAGDPCRDPAAVSLIAALSGRPRQGRPDGTQQPGSAASGAMESPGTPDVRRCSQ
jgi:uncharacterized protein